MTATSAADLEVLMTEKEARNDRIYQWTMCLARKLLHSGAISKAQYNEFDTKMRAKYPPVFGTLFSEIPLI